MFRRFLSTGVCTALLKEHKGTCTFFIYLIFFFISEGSPIDTEVILFLRHSQIYSCLVTHFLFCYYFLGSWISTTFYFSAYSLVCLGLVALATGQMSQMWRGDALVCRDFFVQSNMSMVCSDAALQTKALCHIFVRQGFILVSPPNKGCWYSLFSHCTIMNALNLLGCPLLARLVTILNVFRLWIIFLTALWLYYGEMCKTSRSTRPCTGISG